MQDKKLNTSWWALRVAYGVVPIVAGLDKFTNLLTDWCATLCACQQAPFQKLATAGQLIDLPGSM